MTNDDNISFHTAWGLAKDRDDYDKQLWMAAQSRCERLASRTFSQWLDQVARV